MRPEKGEFVQFRFKGHTFAARVIETYANSTAVDLRVFHPFREKTGIDRAVRSLVPYSRLPKDGCWNR